jgi:2-dehydro-3-deoxygluconokinase
MSRIETGCVPAGKLVCFGEIVGRLATKDFLPLSEAGEFDLHFAGAEANVAVQFAELGGSTAFVSRLPDNRLADSCLERMRGRGVETAGILRGGKRMGLYFLEPGFGARASVITYDRSHSAVSELQPGMIDWDAAFAGATWFHWSGITPPLGRDCGAVCFEAIGAARRLGLKVSCDVNYRSMLWSMEEASVVMPDLVRGTDLCFCGATEARQILGAEGVAEGDAVFGELAASLSVRLGIREVAMLVRSGETAHGGSLKGMFFDGELSSFSRTHELAVVDRIGSGDSFAGAVIFAKMSGMDPQEVVEFGTAAAVWKHTIPGDWNRGTVGEIKALAAGAGGGRVRR